MQEPAELVAPVVAPRSAVAAPAAPTGVAAGAAAAVANDRLAAPPRLDPALLVNRELSLLAFPWRVFDEARDPANPLLERVRFLSIVASNLDEFFMVRVAGLEQQIEAGVGEPSPDGLTPAQQLAAIRREALGVTRAMTAPWQGELRPALDAAGIRVLPVRAPALVRHLRDVVLAAYLADEASARRMRPDGGCERVRGRAEGGVDAQLELLRAAAAADEPGGS